MGLVVSFLVHAAGEQSFVITGRTKPFFWDL
jgi:hypothetical protein